MQKPEGSPRYFENSQSINIWQKPKNAEADIAEKAFEYMFWSSGDCLELVIRREMSSTALQPAIIDLEGSFRYKNEYLGGGYLPP